MHKLAATLLQHLPSHSEEGGVKDSICCDELVSLLSKEQPANQKEAGVFLNLVGLVFDRLGLLEVGEFEQRRWQFCSFPAQLLARSLLSVLADPNQNLFPINFWATDSAGKTTDQQRDILHFLESHRVRHHQLDNPDPIRYVHVAWGLIRLEGGILFHRREDKKRSGFPSYVPVGGRLTLGDLGNKAALDALNILQNTQSPLVEEGLSQTLIREIGEETGLLEGDHFTIEKRLRLKPYRDVEGLGANHAYTEYNIVAYDIRLTQDGFFKLSDEILGSDDLVFFSVEEILRHQKDDGRQAYISAIFKHFEDDHGKIDRWLQGIPESFSNNNLEFGNVTFPFDDAVFLTGKTGKEKEIQHGLTNEQSKLLFTLAWHAKGLQWEPVQKVFAHSFGWIKVCDPVVVKELEGLANALSRVDLPLLEIKNENWVRIRINPDNTFFSDRFYRLDFHQHDGQCILNVSGERTSSCLGCTGKIDKHLNVTLRVFNALLSTRERDLSVIDDSSIEKQASRLDVKVRPVGLRKLTRIKQGNLRLFDQ